MQYDIVIINRKKHLEYVILCFTVLDEYYFIYAVLAKK